MITFKHTGDFSKFNKYLKGVKEAANIDVLEKYGERGVAVLASATPVDSGETANSWHYKIRNTKNSKTISFYNYKVQNGVPIAIILQYGHGTRNGGWVEGRDYINPSIQPMFDELVNDAWREVTKL